MLRVVGNDRREPKAPSRSIAQVALPATITHALQPIVDIHTGSVYAYEALIRGTEAAGFASIDDFFDASFAAGETLGTELALYELAFATTRRLPVDPSRKIFLNVDNRIFENPAFSPEQIAQVADRMGVSRSSVCLELSEKHEVFSSDKVVTVVQGLRAAGLKIAIDDFGQGFSELKTLYDATPEYVKIDRFFINGIAESARKRLFVSTMVNLAHVLGARVIAEGVETEQEFLTCRCVGCDFVQGWFVARPFRDPTSVPARYLLPGGSGDTHHLGLAMAHLVEAELSTVEPVSVNEDFGAVAARFRAAPDQASLVVTDDANEPLGIVLQRDFRGEPTVEGSRRSLRDVLLRTPMVQTDQDVDDILDSVAIYGNVEGVIVTRQFKYAGFLSPSSLVRIINEKRLKIAHDQNGLSQLPGSISISRFIESQLENNSATRIFCNFDFNHFKAFNDTYGFRQGDRIITLFADILRRHLGAPLNFLGHAGGDDFFAGLESDDILHTEHAVDATLAGFRLQAESFYDKVDRANGYLVSLDPEGREQLFPLITGSAAILVVPAGERIESVEQVHRWLNDSQRSAKRSPLGRVTRFLV